MFSIYNNTLSRLISQLAKTCDGDDIVSILTTHRRRSSDKLVSLHRQLISLINSVGLMTQRPIVTQDTAILTSSFFQSRKACTSVLLLGRWCPNEHLEATPLRLRQALEQLWGPERGGVTE